MDATSIKKAVAFLEGFFQDVSQFYVELEKQLAARANLVSHPKAGNKTSWNHSSHFSYPDGWIMKDFHRLYVPKATTETDSAVLCLLSLYSQGLFEAPALICAVLRFKEKLTMDQVFDGSTWNSKLFSAIDRSPSSCELLDSKTQEKLATLKFRDTSNRTEQLSLFAVDIAGVANRDDVGQKVVLPISALYDGRPDDLEHALALPEELVDAWRS